MNNNRGILLIYYKNIKKNKQELIKKMDIKEEIVNILAPIFGKSVIKLVEDNYDSNNPKELVEMADHMLSGYMGEDNAKNMLKKILEKIPHEKAIATK
jgi:hypothetical protein